MNKLLLTAVAAAAMTFNVSAADLVKVPAKVAPQPQATAVQAPVAPLNLTNLVTAIYDGSQNLAEYYVIVSSSSDVKYDQKTGSIDIDNGYMMYIDLYNSITNPPQIPAGVYSPKTEAQGLTAYSFDADYTFLGYYQNGKVVSEAYVDGNVNVVVDEDGNCDISMNVITEDGGKRQVNFIGRVPLTVIGEKESEYPQMKHDVEVNLNKGGIAFYQGVTDYSNNGVTYINLYNVDFDERGAMLADGYNLAMMVAHKRVVSKDKFQLFPGTYTSAYSLERFTWYPCREITYSLDGSVVTTQFGSFIRELNSNSTDRYTYGYLASGEFVLEENGDGTYSGWLDAVTDLGYTVRVNFEGAISLNTDNAEVPAAPLSELQDDVELDFSKLEKGRVFHRGIMGGCRDLTVDLGSPAGRDESINYGGDLLRLEFLAPQSHSVLQPGVYTVVPRRWNDNELAAGGKYEPMSLNQHRFGGSSGGDLDGTRYCHFKEGSYCVYDLWGPVFGGQVRVQTVDYIDYHMDIELEDDAGFQITGTWDGPLELQYDAKVLAEQIAAGVRAVDADGIQVVVEPGSILVLNAGNAPVELFSATGALVARTTADLVIPTDALAHGVYILKVNNQTVKVAL
ncbi:MAG: hypothetical protein NC336_06380 [Clostridium sp.]|nr:hypothetical protein [Clostridium sp.]